MKTTTKYIVPHENNFDYENKVHNAFEDPATNDHNMTFSYIFTMNGEELIQQKVYNYNKFQNDDNITMNGAFFNEANSFTQYQIQQRDRLSSAASTIDETGSDDFVINHDGESHFHRYSINSTTSENDDQDCYIIDQIFPENGYTDVYNENKRAVHDQQVSVSKYNQQESLEFKNKNTLCDHNYITEYKNFNAVKEDICEENFLKIYDDYTKQQEKSESKVNDAILTLFDNTTIDSKHSKSNYKNKRYSNYITNFDDRGCHHGVGGYEEDDDSCTTQQMNKTNEYLTNKWYSSEEIMYSCSKQKSSNDPMINCDESVSTLTVSSNEDSVQQTNSTNGFNFKGFKIYDYDKMSNKYDGLSSNTEEQDTNLPLPPIETVLQQGITTRTRIRSSLNSMIRKNSSSLDCNTKIRNEKGEFGHLSCGQQWQKSTINDINSNVSNNQIIVSQSEGASVDVYNNLKKEAPPGLLECRWEDCWALFQGQSALVRHIEKTHVELRRGEEFACLWEACPRRTRPFNARYKLLIHMRVHSGEKPNKCPFQGCLKAFSRLENLKIHQRSHTGERPYACQFQGCPKAFSNSSDRAKHQRTHFDTKPYACQVAGCNKRYTDPSSLRKHIKNHAGLSTGRTKKLVASEPIVSTNELKTRQRYDSTSSSDVRTSESSLSLSSPIPAVQEDLQILDIKNESDDLHDVTAITDLSDGITEYIPYESIHNLLGEDCLDPANWEETIDVDIEKEFLSLTSDYNSTLMDVNDDNDEIDCR